MALVCGFFWSMFTPSTHCVAQAGCRALRRTPALEAPLLALVGPRNARALVVDKKTFYCPLADVPNLLSSQGCAVSRSMPGLLLRARGYRRLADCKARHRRQPPLRNARIELIDKARANVWRPTSR